MANGKLAGLIWSAVWISLDLPEEDGIAALKPDARGKKPGSGAASLQNQEQAKARNFSAGLALVSLEC
jgi:hypothetical protein